MISTFEKKSDQEYFLGNLGLSGEVVKSDFWIIFVDMTQNVRSSQEQLDFHSFLENSFPVSKITWKLMKMKTDIFEIIIL